MLRFDRIETNNLLGMKKQLLSTFIFLIGTAMTLTSQCYPDRHNTSASSGWISCETSINPNPSRGEGHWIAYDLGEIMNLGQMTLWNTNNPASLTSGAKKIEVDYSLDGINWIFFDSFEVPMGQASGFYEGEVGINFDNLTAEHLLLTITENHGGQCYGFSELRIERFNAVATTDLPDLASLDLFPSPAIDHTFLNYESPKAQQASLTIVDVTGAEIRTIQTHLEGGPNQIRIDLDGLVSGQYYVRLRTATQALTGEVTLINN